VVTTAAPLSAEPDVALQKFCLLVSVPEADPATRLMKRGIPIRRSRAAAGARLVGALSVPVIVIGALGSRIGLVPESGLIPVLILGFALGVLALALAIYAFVDIWNSGVHGAGMAIAGAIYALPCLLALGAVAAAAIAYPRLADISTDPVDPPAIEALGDAPAPRGPDPTLQGTAYPDIAPRIYAQPVAAVYGAARELVEQRGWKILREIPPASLPAATAARTERRTDASDAILDAKTTVTQSRGEAVATAAVNPPPRAQAGSAAEAGTLQAVAATPLLGFPDDVVIAIKQDPAGTRVDMRSASRLGQHDLGQNARRIRRLLADLDVALQPDPNAPATPKPPNAPAGPAPAPGELPAPPPEAVQPPAAPAGQ
jgi:uncharacterized protein (DUF1499 family)